EKLELSPPLAVPEILGLGMIGDQRFGIIVDDAGEDILLVFSQDLAASHRHLVGSGAGIERDAEEELKTHPSNELLTCDVPSYPESVVSLKRDFHRRVPLEADLLCGGPQNPSSSEGTGFSASPPQVGRGHPTPSSAA